MPIAKEELEKLLSDIADDTEIEIVDLAGDNDHYSVTIKSSIFIGKTKLAQHKLVYDKLGSKMGYDLHALQIRTIAK